MIPVRIPQSLSERGVDRLQHRVAWVGSRYARREKLAALSENDPDKSPDHPADRTGRFAHKGALKPDDRCATRLAAFGIPAGRSAQRTLKSMVGEETAPSLSHKTERANSKLFRSGR